ncbi:MAG TPA: branched-chain amino acid ABC transporter permease [Gaiellaceae bacterium]|nr:branched-chain amino acid ABC transporter permease [Gaiellaceae bacterium]
MGQPPYEDPPDEGAGGPVGEPRVGVDSWVASHEGRRERSTGISGRIKAWWQRTPPAGRLLVFVIPAIIFPLVSNSGNIYRYGILTLIYALLAYGLTIVVGFAGLLDLGYIAFFGFGAYAYGYLASQHTGHHWHAELALPVVVVASAGLGIILGSPSLRLLGDYLAIVTLFFGQAFVIFVNNANRIDFPFFGQVDLTGGAQGLEGVDPLNFFGYKVSTNKGYFYVAVIMLVLIVAMLHLVNHSRTGRAWRALREDPLAAEVLSIPVNRLKILAFAFGAAVAGLIGCLYSSIQTLDAPGDYSVGLLITIYAIVILGGAGSLSGVIIAALIVNGVPELLRNPSNGRYVFYVGLLLVLWYFLKTWQRLLIVLGGTLVFGWVLYGISSVVWDRGTSGQPVVDPETGSNWLSTAISHWMLTPTDRTQIANWAFFGLVILIMIATLVRGWWQVLVLIPTVWIAAFAWENLLFTPDQINGPTRLLLLGTVLVVLMNARPQGLFGTRQVEIV